VGKGRVLVKRKERKASEIHLVTNMLAIKRAMIMYTLGWE
jgi:hypothetical protein